MVRSKHRTSSLRKIIWVASFAGFAAGFNSACLAADRSTDLTRYSWSSTAAPSLAQAPPSKKVVENFLHAVQTSVWGESDLGGLGYVCSFRFVDLRGNGNLSLVAGTGVNDRGCGQVYIVDKTKTGFEAYLSGGALGTGQDVSADLVDLRKDGRLQLLVYSTLGSIISGCTAVSVSIFAWTGSNYTDVSDQFKDYYLKKRESLKRKMADEKSRRRSPLASVCSEVEIAQIERSLGLSPDAGIQIGISLSNSGAWPVREFAADVLGEIGTPEAKRYLEILANDKDGSVAYLAKTELKGLANGPRKRAPDAFKQLDLNAPIQVDMRP